MSQYRRGRNPRQARARKFPYRDYGMQQPSRRKANGEKCAGVVVGPRRHQLVMKYRPFPVYFGLCCALAGLAAVFLQRRKEDGAG